MTRMSERILRCERVVQPHGSRRPRTSAVQSNAHLIFVRCIVRTGAMKLVGAFVAGAVLVEMAISPSSVTAQSLTALHNFTNSQSVPVPFGRLVPVDGTLYGTAANAGSNGGGVVYSVNTDGTGFAVLHDFSSDTNGGAPEGGLLLKGDT